MCVTICNLKYWDQFGKTLIVFILLQQKFSDIRIMSKQLKLAHLSIRPLVQISGFDGGKYPRAAVLPHHQGALVGPEDWLVVIDILNQQQ